MGVRFRKSKQIIPGVKLNVSKSGAGVRVGGKSAGVSVGPRGTRASASIPGSGISYSTKIGGSKSKPAASSVRVVKPVVFRWWYVALAIIFVISGIGGFAKDIASGFATFAIGAIMFVFTFLKARSIKKANSAENEDTQE